MRRLGAGARRRLTKDPTRSGLEGMPDADLRVYLNKTGAVIDRISEIGLPKPGNHAENSRVEQYVIDNDEGVYRWVLRWTSDIRTYLERQADA